MKKIILAAAVLLGIFMGETAIAQQRTPAVNRHQLSQHQRIRQGVRSGALTHHEAMRLRLQQARIQGMKRMAKADGFVSPRERMVLRQAQRNANRSIYHSRHNRMRHY